MFLKIHDLSKTVILKHLQWSNHHKKIRTNDSNHGFHKSNQVKKTQFR